MVVAHETDNECNAQCENDPLFSGITIYTPPSCNYKIGSTLGWEQARLALTRLSCAMTLTRGGWECWEKRTGHHQQKYEKYNLTAVSAAVGKMTLQQADSCDSTHPLRKTTNRHPSHLKDSGATQEIQPKKVLTAGQGAGGLLLGYHTSRKEDGSSGCRLWDCNPQKTRAVER